MTGTRLCPTALLAGAAAALLLGPAGSRGDPPDGKPGPPPGGPPALVPVWRKSTLGLDQTDDPFGGGSYADARPTQERVYAAAADARRKAGRPLIPPAWPAVAGDLVAVATDRGVAAFALRDTTLYGRAFGAGRLAWAQDRDTGLAQMAQSLGVRALTAYWAQRHPPADLADLVSNRTLAGAVVAGHGHVHFADDLALVPPAGEVRDRVPAGHFAGPLARNNVRAAALDTGKLALRVPYLAARGPAPAPGLFLGPPLPALDGWFVLEERDRVARLARVYWDRWKRGFRKGSPTADADSRVWEAEVATAPTTAATDPHRRIHAVFLTEAAGLVLCPTHLGRVAAVETGSGKVRWAYEYAPPDAKRFPTFAPEWVVVPPAVAGGRYVYAPADFPELLCLHVADGKKAWSVPKGDGLYPAVVGDRVLVVGEKAVRCLGLKDGSEQWTADLPGRPCGRGAVHGDSYLVPVADPRTGQGRIAVTDLKGRKVAEVWDVDGPVGNLVVHEGHLLCQGLTDVAVFRLRVPTGPTGPPPAKKGG